MKLSAPIHQLKSKAKKLKTAQKIPLSQALDLVAKEEGYSSWSLLASKQSEFLPKHFSEVFDYFNPGDLILVSARPMAGKLVFALGLTNHANSSYVFSLTESNEELEARLVAPTRIDCSDEICAQYIIDAVGNQVTEKSLIIIDYLQMLDEQRSKAPIQTQITQLKAFAKTTQSVIVFLCQIDRQINSREDQRPTLADIRLPNPLDLSLFNKQIFLCREKTSDVVNVSIEGHVQHHFSIRLTKNNRKFN